MACQNFAARCVYSRLSQGRRRTKVEIVQRQTEKAFQSLLADSGLGNSVRGKVLHGNPAKIIPQPDVRFPSSLETLYSKGNRLDAFISRSEMLERMFTTPGIFRSTPSIKSL